MAKRNDPPLTTWYHVIDKDNDRNLTVKSSFLSALKGIISIAKFTNKKSATDYIRNKTKD